LPSWPSPPSSYAILFAPRPLQTLQRYYRMIRHLQVHRYFLSWITLIGFLLASLEDFPCSAYPPHWQARATSQAGCHSARKQVSSELCPAVTITPRFGHRHIAFDTSTVVPLGSYSCLIPDPVNARPFPSALTTIALGHSRRRWFGTCSCKPVPRGLP
jgi:hypothetical protein